MKIRYDLIFKFTEMNALRSADLTDGRASVLQKKPTDIPDNYCPTPGDPNDIKIMASDPFDREFKLPPHQEHLVDAI